MRILFYFILSAYSFAFCIERNSFEGIEYFIEKPKAEGCFPAVVFIHGFQPEENSQGGEECLNWSFFQNLSQEGVIAVAISIPGFGGTLGKRDYCGPIAQNAVIALIDHLKTHSFIEKTKIGLVGVSRGACTAAMVSSRYDGLAFQVLIAGKYDFTEPFSKYFTLVKNNFLKESDGNWKDRSALYHADSIQTPTLIFHGALDPVYSPISAQKLHDALINRGVPSRLIVFPKLSHYLVGTSEVYPQFISFLREKLFDKTGIGISLCRFSDYHQLYHFLEGFPAERSMLQLGDILLGVSPKNDKTMINTVGMSTNQIANLLLGKKGTELRLKVAHLNGIEEEVVLIR